MLYNTEHTKTYSSDELRRYIPEKYRASVKEVQYLGQFLGKDYRSFRNYRLSLADGYEFMDGPVYEDATGYSYSFPEPNSKTSIVITALSHLRFILEHHVQATRNTTRLDAERRYANVQNASWDERYHS